MHKGILKSLSSLILSSSLFFNSGCGNLYKKFIIGDNKEALIWYENGYDPIHINSCGPRALHEMFLFFDECVDSEDISKEILQYRTFLRNFSIGIIRMPNANSMGITFPDEIQDTLKRHGYALEIITGDKEEMLDYLLKMCFFEEKGIVRLKDPNSISQHWSEFPPETLFRYYGDNSIIVEIYNVRK